MHNELSRKYSSFPYIFWLSAKQISGLLKLKALFQESFVTPETNGQRSQLISQTLKSAAESCVVVKIYERVWPDCVFFDGISLYSHSDARIYSVTPYPQLSLYSLNSTSTVLSSAFDRGARESGSKSVIWSFGPMTPSRARTRAIVARHWTNELL